MKPEQPESAVERKRALRLEMSRRLGGVEADQASRCAARVGERVLELTPAANARGVLTCLSFGSEIDTWGIVDRLRRTGRLVYVPRADPRDLQLHVHPYPCELETLSFGLKQPIRGCEEVPRDRIDEVIDLALLPGLAFDREGYRLGYGRGYFDRFLANRQFPAIGLAYAFQIVDQIPHQSHDIPMSAVVTEDGTFWSGRAP